MFNYFIKSDQNTFFKWANPGLFFIYIQSFQTNNTIYTTNQCKNVMSFEYRYGLGI